VERTSEFEVATMSMLRIFLGFFLHFGRSPITWACDSCLISVYFRLIYGVFCQIDVFPFKSIVCFLFKKESFYECLYIYIYICICFLSADLRSHGRVFLVSLPFFPFVFVFFLIIFPERLAVCFLSRHVFMNAYSCIGFLVFPVSLPFFPIPFVSFLIIISKSSSAWLCVSCHSMFFECARSFLETGF